MSQIAHAAEFGLAEHASDKAHLPVLAYRKSRHEDLDHDEPSRFLMSRFAKTLMPNRAGMHFDLDAYYCWAIAESQICSFGTNQKGFMLQAREDRLASPLATLWLVSECDECAPEL